MELRGNETDAKKALWHIWEISNPTQPPLNIRGSYPLNTRMNLF
jgi:hypothetical protein